MIEGLIILGAGGHARVLVAALRAAGVNPVGCVALARPGPEWPADIPYLGGDEIIDGLDRNAVRLVNGIGSVGDCTIRQSLFEAGKARGFLFAPVIHPSAILHDPGAVGEGGQIMAGAVLQTGVVVGDNVIVNTAAVVDHDCYLAAHSHVAPGAVLSGGVHVGVRGHVGTGATVIQGVQIGARALVAAGAVVVRDVPVGISVAGVPARAMTNV